MTTTMNKSKLRGNPDGSSGSIVITADTEAEAEAEAEGRGQTADSRLGLGPGLRLGLRLGLRHQKAARHHCPAADKIKRN